MHSIEDCQHSLHGSPALDRKTVMLFWHATLCLSVLITTQLDICAQLLSATHLLLDSLCCYVTCFHVHTKHAWLDVSMLGYAVGNSCCTACLQVQSSAERGVFARPGFRYADDTSSVRGVAEPECCILSLVCPICSPAKQAAVHALYRDQPLAP